MFQTTDSLKTDLYELTMAAGYFQNRYNPRATFELFCHQLPENRNYLITCGLSEVIAYIFNLRFDRGDIQYIRSLPAFRRVQPAFYDFLRSFHFTGDIWAVPEGEVVFANEPIIQVDAPIIEAQMIETFLLAIMHIETLVATKAARIVQAAKSDGITRGVVDFGSRRAHGPDAAVHAARAAYIAGCMGTSNMYAGRKYDIPVYGTIAHSWVEAYPSEEVSFNAYHQIFPEHTTLLIDTYDTLSITKKLSQFYFRHKIKAVRIDSGDLAVMSKHVRKILDDDGLSHVKIIASGNLNEHKIAELIKSKAPIDLFGVGTEMVTSKDEPALDLTYKLVQINDPAMGLQFKAKRSQGKHTIPGKKQLYRKYSKSGKIEKDVLMLYHDHTKDKMRSLLQPVVIGGRLHKPMPTLDQIRTRVQQSLHSLPDDFLHLKKKKRFEIELGGRVKAASQKMEDQHAQVIKMPSKVVQDKKGPVKKKGAAKPALKTTAKKTSGKTMKKAAKKSTVKKPMLKKGIKKAAPVTKKKAGKKTAVKKNIKRKGKK
ncbi:MAG: nicotinate phosphoribosyltransferase [Candidatus Omnitrophica bacterium]|nr:nicotinate phosphoribosyltransferase [Candidatus Omnitrophota bacterium]